jgi:hypothetical protein
MTKLNNTGIERYSPAERGLFQLLPKNDEPVTSTALMEEFYKGRRVPVNGRTVMNISLKRLADKAKHNKEPFQVIRSKQKGLRALKWHVRLLPPH